MTHVRFRWLDRARRSTPSGESGQTLVLVVLFMVVMIGMAALVVDFGAWLTERRTYQNAADAAALVAVNQLRPPIDNTAQQAAVTEALASLDRQLSLGLAITASPSQAASGITASNGDIVYVSTPPNPDCGSPGSYVGNLRAVTVRIDHPSQRFFSGLFASATQHVGVCATAASEAGAYAVAVLQPPVGTQPNSTNVTFNLAGAGTTVNITGGEAASNATFGAQGNPCQNPPCHVSPAVLHFTTSGNLLHLGIPNPSPMPWTSSPAQITDPNGNYLPPVALTHRITIPGWGPGPWVNNDTSPPSTYDPNGAPATYNGQQGAPSGTLAGNCYDPTSNGTVHGLAPGNYSQINLANGQRLWLCPGVFHLVVGTTGQASLVMAQSAVLAGEGVTLAFEANQTSYASMSSAGGSMICLNFDQSLASQASCGTATQANAPWTTGWSLHDNPISIWIRPVSDCDPLAATPCSDSSKVFQMAGGSGIVERGIIYGPTDNIVLASANTTQASSSGEIWAWTLAYKGQSTLNQVFDGPSVDYPTLVQ